MKIVTFCKILTYGGLFVAFIIVMAWVITESQVKANYKRDYDRLVMYVWNSIITAAYYDFICQKFEDIKRYRCCDIQKLAKLEQAFEDRFDSVKSIPK